MTDFSSEIRKLGESSKIDKNIIALHNKSNKDIKILLGEYSFTLGKNSKTPVFDTILIKRKSVWESDPYEKNLLISIKSDKVTIEYILVLGNEFLIFWNKEKKYWDVQLL